MDGADWLRTQLTSFGCAACGRAYRADGIRVLAERDGLFFVDLGCETCGSDAVAIVTIQAAEDGETLDAGEVLPVQLGAGDAPDATAAPVDAEDVLGMHHFLAGFDGDFEALFGRGSGPRA
jgi:hypothetical protein